MTTPEYRNHSFVYLKNLIDKIIKEQSDPEELEQITLAIFQRLLNFCRTGDILNLNPINTTIDFMILICDFEPVAGIFFHSRFFFRKADMGQRFHANSIMGSILGLTTFS